MKDGWTRRGRTGLVSGGLRALSALAILLAGVAVAAGEPAGQTARAGRSASTPAAGSAAAGASSARQAPRVAARARLIGLRAPLPPRSARAEPARFSGAAWLAASQPCCFTVVQVERWPLWVRDDWFDRYDWRLPSAARVVPATGSPATVSAAYVVRAYAGDTILPRASISRGRPDVPLETQPASRIFVPHHSR